LARHFLDRARARHRLAVTGIDDRALRALCGYGWPGNVRELENTIDRATVLCEGGEIDLASLPDRVAAFGRDDAAPSPGSDWEDSTGDLSIKHASRRMEENLIRRALSATGGNRTRAAELLEISHRALLYKIREFGVAGPAKGGNDSGPAADPLDDADTGNVAR